MKCKKFFRVLAVFLVYELIRQNDEISADFEQWFKRKYPRKDPKLDLDLDPSKEDPGARLYRLLNQYVETVIWPEVDRSLDRGIEGIDDFLEQDASRLFQVDFNEDWPRGSGKYFPFSSNVQDTLRKGAVAQLVVEFGEEKKRGEGLTVPLVVGTVIANYLEKVAEKFIDFREAITDFVLSNEAAKL
ncbi:MAG: hypothetical protein WCV50_05890 [Patescibacteria group bacterium]|jgi:hypothetical protein